MDTPTPLQQSIEATVTNKRGYAPQVTSRLPLQFPEVMYAMEVRAFLEYQRLQDTLFSMERQKLSPTLDALFTSYIDRILRNSPRPGRDIEFIKPNFEDPRRFSKIYLLKEILPKPTDSSSFPWDSEKARAYRDALRHPEQDPREKNPPKPYHESSDPLAKFKDPFAKQRLKGWEFPYTGSPWKEEPTRHEFPYLQSRLEQPTLRSIPLAEKAPEPRPFKKYNYLKNDLIKSEPPRPAPRQVDTSELLQFLPPSQPSSIPTSEEPPLNLTELLCELQREEKERRREIFPKHKE